MNLDQRHLDLLRKRYRLPVSLLTHETPPSLSGQGVTADADAGTLTVLLSCSKDMDGLAELCESQGLDKICVHYANFISLWCVNYLKDEIDTIRDATDIEVVVLNPWVPKEKMRLLHKLNGLSTRLAAVCSMLDEGGDPTQQRECLRQMASEFAMERDMAGKRTRALQRKKQRFLDHLIMLELRPDAPPQARAEGRWLLRHHKRGSYNFAHVGDQLSANLLEVIRSQLEESRGDNGGIPSHANLRKVRRNVLRSFGRFHLEVKLQQVLSQVCASIHKYMQQESTEVELCEFLVSQRQVLNNLMSKRSLIGCRLINLDDPLGWEYDIDTDNEGEGDSSNNDTDDSDSGLNDGDDYQEEDGEGDEGAHQAGNTSHDDELYGEEDDVLLEDPNEDDDSNEEFWFEVNHGAHQAPHIWPQEFGNVMYCREDYEEHQGGKSSSEKDVMFDSPPKPSVTIVEQSAEPDVPEESPISASSIISTNSEIGDAYAVEYLAKHGEVNDPKETLVQVSQDNLKLTDSEAIAQGTVQSDSVTHIDCAMAPTVAVATPAGATPASAASADSARAAKGKAVVHHEETKECVTDSRLRSTNVKTIGTDDAKLQEPEDVRNQRRSARKVKRNAKYYGPQWVK